MSVSSAKRELIFGLGPTDPIVLKILMSSFDRNRHRVARRPLPIFHLAPELEASPSLGSRRNERGNEDPERDARKCRARGNLNASPWPE